MPRRRFCVECGHDPPETQLDSVCQWCLLARLEAPRVQERGIGDFGFDSHAPGAVAPEAPVVVMHGAPGG